MFVRRVVFQFATANGWERLPAVPLNGFYSRSRCVFYEYSVNYVTYAMNVHYAHNNTGLAHRYIAESIVTTSLKHGDGWQLKVDDTDMYTCAFCGRMLATDIAKKSYKKLSYRRDSSRCG